MISHKHRSIFINIPNTTGISIENTLMNSGGQFQQFAPTDFKRNKTPAHAFGYDGLSPWPEKYFPARFLKDEYDDYFKFCFIRNPWDLVVSNYFWWTQQTELKYQKQQGRILDKLGFSDYIFSCYTDYINEIFHCALGQCYWILDDTGIPSVDFIGRFENLQHDFDRALGRIGLPHITLPTANKPSPKDFRENYTPQTREIIKLKFKRDIETFDYRFNENETLFEAGTNPGRGNKYRMIWLASWPRSGNTFLRTILWHCFGYKSSSVYPNDLAGNKPLEEYVGHIERATQNTMESSNHNIPSLVKTHEPPSDRNPAIYVVRDGRPACVSFWKFYNQSLPLTSVIAGQHRFGSWGQHIVRWNPLNRPRTLFLKYEEMLSDLQGTIEKIASYLNKDPIRNEIPPRENIAKVGGQHVKLKSDWTEVLTKEYLDLFWQVNGEMMNEIYGEKI